MGRVCKMMQYNDKGRVNNMMQWKDRQFDAVWCLGEGRQSGVAKAHKLIQCSGVEGADNLMQCGVTGGQTI